MDLRLTTPNETERAIIAGLDALAADPASRAWDNAGWTRRVKNAVGLLGLDRKYWVCASSCDHANEGEWLYDLCWLEYDGSSLAGAVLVLESEWDPGSLDDDFMKLVLARADHRIFLFDIVPDANSRAIIEKPLRNVRSLRHTASGDRYLFGAWSTPKWAFEWLAYEVVGLP